LLNTEVNPFIRGFSQQLLSSGHLSWKNLSLELHDASPAERGEAVSHDHLIAMSIDGTMCGEKALSSNHFVPVSFDPSVISLLPAGRVPACKLFSPARLLICSVAPQLVKEICWELEVPEVTEFPRKFAFRDHPLRGLLLLLAAEARSGEASGRLYSEHLAHALALRLIHLSGGILLTSGSHNGKLPPRILQRVLEKMRENLAADIDLDLLVNESGYSRSHFLRMFRATMGCSPHQWLTKLRVEKAKILLRKTPLRMIDIAIACGFSSSAHFSNRFHQIVGQPPSKYKRDRS
jgi:AraC family transcriptional regulator